MEVVCLIFGPTLTSCVSTIPTLFTYILGFDVAIYSFIIIENEIHLTCKLHTPLRV